MMMATAKTCPRPPEVAAMLGYDEEVLWEGKPDKTAFFVKQLFFTYTPVKMCQIFLVTSAVLLLLSFVPTVNFGVQGMILSMIIFLAVFILVEIIVFFRLLRSWGKEYYLMTDQRIIFFTVRPYRNGDDLNKWFGILLWADVRNVSLKVSGADRRFGVGEIHFHTSKTITTPGGYDGEGYYERPKTYSIKNVFYDLANIDELYPRIEKIVSEMKLAPKYRQPQPVSEYCAQPQLDANTGYGTRKLDV
jgi:hypothetical protein